MSEIKNYKQSELEILLKQILMAIRGAWTQEEMSKKLGFSALQVHRWENLKVTLSWTDFCKICQLRRAPLKTAFEKFYAYTGDLYDGTIILHMIRAGVSQKEILEKTTIKATRLSKIFNGHEKPTMVEVLQIMFVCQSWFWEFWAEIVKAEKAPMIQGEIEKRSKQISVSLRFPFTGALLEILALKKYQDTNIDTVQFLADELQISLPIIKSALGALSEAGLLNKLDNGKYQVHSSDVNLGRDFQAAKTMMEYWMQRQLNLLKNTRSKPQGSFYSYMAVPLSEESFREVRQLFLELYQKIVTISKSDSNQHTHIYTYTAGFIRTDERPML